MFNLEANLTSICDDFGSTFKLLSDNKLMNTLRPDEFDEVTKIIYNYIPGCKVSFILIEKIAQEFGLYIIMLSRHEEI